MLLNILNCLSPLTKGEISCPNFWLLLAHQLRLSGWALALSHSPRLGHQEEEAPCLHAHKGATQASAVLGPLCVCCPVLPGPSSLPQALLTLRPDQLLPGFRAGSQGPAEAGAGPIGALWPVGGFVGSVFLHSRGNSDLRLSGSPGPMSLCVSG